MNRVKTSSNQDEPFLKIEENFKKMQCKLNQIEKQVNSERNNSKKWFQSNYNRPSQDNRRVPFSQNDKLNGVCHRCGSMVTVNLHVCLNFTKTDTR